MKSLRVLVVLAVLSLGAGVASANCGSCDKKEACPAGHEACAEKCDAKAAGEKKECPAGEQAKAKHTCCEEAAKAGKTCAKCQPAEKKA